MRNMGITASEARQHRSALIFCKKEWVEVTQLIDRKGYGMGLMDQQQAYQVIRSGFEALDRSRDQVLMP